MNPDEMAALNAKADIEPLGWSKVKDWTQMRGPGGTIISHKHCTLDDNCLTGLVPVSTPYPREPIDLTRATVEQMNEELKELRDYRPAPEGVLGDYRQSASYQAALRDLALRQVSASRARYEGQ